MTRSDSQSLRRPGRPVGEASGAGRVALLDAARELIRERGLARLTAKEVAERAGVRPTLVNYYFGDRRGLMRELATESSGALNQEMATAVAEASGADERLERLMHGILQRFAEEPYAARLFFEQVVFAEDEVIDRFVEEYGREAFGLFGEVLTEGIEAGLFRDVDPEIAIAAIGGICIFFGAAGPLLTRVMNVEPLTEGSASDIARRAANLILDGLRVPRRSASDTPPPHSET